MQITFGKHTGKSVELLMLKEPNYIKWLLMQQNASGGMAAAQRHIKTMSYVFDKKPFIDKICCAKNCNKIATRFTVYLDNLDARWWCDACDPYQLGASPGKLQSPIGYIAALQHVEMYCSGRTSDYKDIIKTISQAKGLPLRVGEIQAQKFFT